jgi:hypothetical protein
MFPGGKGGRYVGLTNLPPSCADCLKIWEPKALGTLTACPGLQWDCFSFSYCMEQSPYWVTSRFSASQEISRILWNPKFCYLIQTPTDSRFPLFIITIIIISVIILYRIHFRVNVIITNLFSFWTMRNDQNITVCLIRTGIERIQGTQNHNPTEKQKKDTFNKTEQ